MLVLADQRIELDPRPALARGPVLEVAMLGHCPGRVRWDRLAADRQVAAEIMALGFQAEVARLQALAGGLAAEPADEPLCGLQLLPIPIYSLAQFQDLFPEAFQEPGRCRSRLAGSRAWLPWAVEDFFRAAAPLPDGAKKLWVIRVPETVPNAPPQAAFLPDPEADLLDPARLGAFERALLIPHLGLVALPDLERLQIPANLADIPRLRLPNPEPVFLPAGTDLDDSHRERRHSSEMPRAEGPLPLAQVAAPIVQTLSRLRPDVTCLLTLPLDEEPAAERPCASAAGLASLAAMAREEAVAGGHGLFRLQLLYPYLRGKNRPLASPVGIVAGAMAETAARQGPWRSVAGRPLPGPSLPYPPVRQDEATRLREDPGIGVLLARRGRLELDDERLLRPAVPRASFLATAAARRARHASDFRSGELARFLGWLRRQLVALGEQLVFDVDPRDPRPQMALAAFAGRLHRLGALRGPLPEQAFRVQQSMEGESTVVLSLEIAPSLPIDRIRITFSHDRASGQTGSSLTVGS
ncbi:MAG: hypothetical protein AB1634_03220 [Thermodesulfobacteriota bacterium]